MNSEDNSKRKLPTHIILTNTHGLCLYSFDRSFIREKSMYFSFFASTIQVLIQYILDGTNEQSRQSHTILASIMSASIVIWWFIKEGKYLLIFLLISVLDPSCYLIENSKTNTRSREYMDTIARHTKINKRVIRTGQIKETRYFFWKTTRILKQGSYTDSKLKLRTRQSCTHLTSNYGNERTRHTQNQTTETGWDGHT